jgi:S-(hydroxymethyl)glutathione dehydrogenase / alcohol dehydrogenase
VRSGTIMVPRNLTPVLVNVLPCRGPRRRQTGAVTTTRAAVLREPGKPLSLETIDLADTAPGMVRVRIAASGVCHSDLTLRNGTLPHPIPAVLGYEGAGVVTAVGEGVTRVAPGDHVILTWSPPCRDCFYCHAGQPHLCERCLANAMAAPYATAGGEPLHSMMGVSTFAEETVALEAAAVRIDPDVPFEVAALIGCGVTTGVGAALNTARVPAGATVVVVGCGGVGLAVIQGARLAGAARIVAVDLSTEHLAIAEAVGATETVDAGATDPVQEVLARTHWRGADHVFEVVGRSATIQQADAMTRRGRQLTVVGAGSRIRSASAPLSCSCRRAP